MRTSFVLNVKNVIGRYWGRESNIKGQTLCCFRHSATSPSTAGLRTSFRSKSSTSSKSTSRAAASWSALGLQRFGDSHGLQKTQAQAPATDSAAVRRVEGWSMQAHFDLPEIAGCAAATLWLSGKIKRRASG